MLTLVVVAVTNLISNPYKQIDDQSLLWETNQCFHHGTHKIKEVEEKNNKTKQIKQKDPAAQKQRNESRQRHRSKETTKQDSRKANKQRSREKPKCKNKK